MNYSFSEVKQFLKTVAFYSMLPRFSSLALHIRPSIQFVRFTTKSSIDFSLVPKIDEKDLDESFVRGSGPGGQSVNKTANCVVLKHVPTGIVIKCHEHRSVSQNRKSARKILISKLDNLHNGEMSVENQKKNIDSKRSIEAQRRRKKLDELKRIWKEREGLS